MDCEGSWGDCLEVGGNMYVAMAHGWVCQQSFEITKDSANGGSECEAGHGDVQGCSECGLGNHRTDFFILSLYYEI